MTVLSGRRLTIVGAVLIALAAAAAARVVASGIATSGAPAAPGGPATAGRGPALSAADHVALAAAAEARGDVGAALSHYRAAVASDPRCVDRRSPEFLGEAFEAKLGRWLSGLRSGRIAAGPAALSDASFLFRRMYGGCG